MSCPDLQNEWGGNVSIKHRDDSGRGNITHSRESYIIIVIVSL